MALPAATSVSNFKSVGFEVAAVCICSTNSGVTVMPGTSDDNAELATVDDADVDSSVKGTG